MPIRRVSLAADSTAIAFEGAERSYGGFDRASRACAVPDLAWRRSRVAGGSGFAAVARAGRRDLCGCACGWGVSAGGSRLSCRANAYISRLPGRVVLCA